jgi:hypothetical protein
VSDFWRSKPTLLVLEFFENRKKAFFSKNNSESFFKLVRSFLELVIYLKFYSSILPNNFKIVIQMNILHVGLTYLLFIVTVLYANFEWYNELQIQLNGTMANDKSQITFHTECMLSLFAYYYHSVIVFSFCLSQIDPIKRHILQWNLLNGITVNRFIRLMGSFL